MPKLRRLNVLIPAVLFDQVDQIVKKREETITWFVREAIRREIEKFTLETNDPEAWKLAEDGNIEYVTSEGNRSGR